MKIVASKDFRRSGSAVLIVLILLFLMVSFLAMNSATLTRLDHELKLVDEQQKKRFESPANTNNLTTPPK